MFELEGEALKLFFKKVEIANLLRAIGTSCSSVLTEDFKVVVRDFEEEDRLKEALTQQGGTE